MTPPKTPVSSSTEHKHSSHIREAGIIALTSIPPQLPVTGRLKKHQMGSKHHWWGSDYLQIYITVQSLKIELPTLTSPLFAEDTTTSVDTITKPLTHLCCALKRKIHSWVGFFFAPQMICLLGALTLLLIDNRNISSVDTVK